VLAALPEDERALIAPHLSCVQLSLGQNLANGLDEGGAAVHFPITAVMSVAILTKGGRPAEMAVVGRDGLIGRWLFPGASMVPVRIVVQHEGQAVRLATSVLQEMLTRGGVLRRLFFNYMHRFAMQLARTTAHADDLPVQYLCRWLLLSLDESGPVSTLPSQPEWLARYFGVPAQSMRDALAMLAECGAIVCEPTTIRVRDRAQLEQHAAA
jgi:hypothetical protein